MQTSGLRRWWRILRDTYADERARTLRRAQHSAESDAQDPLEHWKVLWLLATTVLYAVHYVRLASDVSWTWLAWVHSGALAAIGLATVVLGATWLKRWGNGGRR